MRRAKSMFVYDVPGKTQKLQVRGTRCKCCSRSQQRSSPGLRLRLTPRIVLIDFQNRECSSFTIFPGLLNSTNCDRTPPHFEKKITNKCGEKLFDNNGQNTFSVIFRFLPLRQKAHTGVREGLHYLMHKKRHPYVALQHN